jgi:hypothetical protein
MFLTCLSHKVRTRGAANGPGGKAGCRLSSEAVGQTYGEEGQNPSPHEADDRSSGRRHIGSVHRHE